MTLPVYDHRVPRIWTVTLVILVACLIASMVIATAKLT
jgi:Na+-transporting NADH:ubiquinone oxidoreductase subunit NqrC